MSEESDDLQDIQGGPTWEEALHKLLKEEGLSLHTEILHPDAMTLIDAAGEHWAQTISPGVGKFIAKRQKWYRKNMAAFERKRAIEIVDGIKGNVEKERNKKTLEEVLQGVQR